MKITIPWLVIFVILKFVSHYVAAWSWLWLLFPPVPVIAWFIHWMGWTL